MSGTTLVANLHRRWVLGLLPALLLAACGAGPGSDDPRNRHGGPNGDYTFPATDYVQQAPGKRDRKSVV